MDKVFFCQIIIFLLLIEVTKSKKNKTSPPETSSSIQTTILQDTSTMTAKSTETSTTASETSSSIQTINIQDSTTRTATSTASSMVSTFQSQWSTTEPHPASIFTSEFGHNIESNNTDTLFPTTHPSDLVMTPSDNVSVKIESTASLKPKSDVRAVYIAVSVGVCVIAGISVILVLIWRYRRKHSQPNSLKRDRIHGSSFTNRTYAVDALERQSSLINGRPSGDSEYAEISPKTAHCEEASDNVYNTIDNVLENKSESNTTYGHIKQHGRELIDSNYSHVKLNSTTEETGTDNTYAHTTVAEVPNQTQKSPDDVDDADVTYNRLDIRSLNTTSTNKWKTTEEAEKETEVEYNHTNTGGQESVNDTYSHLNNDLAASPKHSQTGTIHVNVKEMSTSNHDLAKETKQRQYDYAAVSPKRENTVQSQAKLNQQRPGDNHRLQNSYCQAYDFAKEPDITPYEFAKDFDKFSTDDTVKHYPIQIEMQTSKVQMKKCAEANGYETAVVTPHDYLILEPEERTFGKETSFRVVEEELPETRHTDDNEEPEKHQYFTLERMDIN